MSNNKWNWSSKDWPNFSYDQIVLEELEFKFLENSGTVLGILKHIKENDKDELLVELLSNEAIKTSEIEGEFLNRESVQSSIKRNLGLSIYNRKVPPAEYGIAEMMVDLYENFDKQLNHNLLFEWHKMLTNGRRDLLAIGKYRTHKEPMQVVSGRIDRPTIHFEAPPSDKVLQEMEQFLEWFNITHSKNKKHILIKAGITHLYFVSIHPFEDGNGRISRALAEKSIALSLNKPSLISLSHTIEANKRGYYEALEANNKSLDITDWLLYFGKTILQAQSETIKKIEFIIEKTIFFDKYSNELNKRQLKVILKLFDAGHVGFKGGLSAENYQRIAKTSSSTTTRDLNNLVEKNILLKTGKLKGTRYLLNIKKV